MADRPLAENVGNNLPESSKPPAELLGGLLWGEGQTIRLSLDRGDLWDLRTPA